MCESMHKVWVQVKLYYTPEFDLRGNNSGEEAEFWLMHMLPFAPVSGLNLADLGECLIRKHHVSNVWYNARHQEFMCYTEFHRCNDADSFQRHVDALKAMGEKHPTWVREQKPFE